MTPTSPVRLTWVPPHGTRAKSGICQKRASAASSLKALTIAQSAATMRLAAAASPGSSGATLAGQAKSMRALSAAMWAPIFSTSPSSR